MGILYFSSFSRLWLLSHTGKPPSQNFWPSCHWAVKFRCRDSLNCQRHSGHFSESEQKVGWQRDSLKCSRVKWAHKYSLESVYLIKGCVTTARVSHWQIAWNMKVLVDLQETREASKDWSFITLSDIKKCLLSLPLEGAVILLKHLWFLTPVTHGGN